MPSVVFLTVDCLRADHLGCYGCERDTSPNIDELATAGTRYEHAYANCPGTRWAFQSLHTGVSTHRFDGLGIPDGYKTLATLFSNAGYETGGFAVNGFVSREYNYDKGFNTFYSVADAEEKTPIIKRIGKTISRTINSERVDKRILRPLNQLIQGQSESTSERFQPDHSDEDTVNQALDFIEKQQNDGDEYFCWIHFMDAHTPYGFWPEHLEAVRGDTAIEHTIHPGNEGKITVGEAPPQDVIDTYDACIGSVDEQIGRVLSAIDDDAIVILTGDHGEEFGRYNEFHSASLYSSMTQVPIIIRSPSVSVGVSETPVQHLDLPPTMLTAANITVPDHFEGEALQTIERPPDEPIFFSLGADQMAIRKGKWKLFGTNGRQKLYNVPHSGTEFEPVREKSQEIIQELHELLVSYREIPTVGEGESDLSTGREDISDEIENNLEELGYL